MITRARSLRGTPEVVFALFTERISEWWPPERRHTGDPESRLVLSPLEGFFEQARDGQLVALGTVRAWEPPRRLVLDWYPGTDREHPTSVEVRFVPEPPDRTRVEVQHGPTPASEALFPLRAPRYLASWDLVLAALDRAAGA